MPIIALLSSRFGRKRFYIFSVLLFTGASMLCGLAWDLTSIVVFRIMQGMGGGTLIPISQAMLRETFPHEEQGTAMGIYGLGTILGPAFGPTLGGWLTDTYSWRWIFYINVPVGIANIFLIMQFIKDPPYLVREKGKLDFAGLFFMCFGLGALQIMLEKGNQKDWFSSGLIRYLAISACIGLVLFVWRELTTDRPAVNLRILKEHQFLVGDLPRRSPWLGPFQQHLCAAALLTATPLLSRIQRRAHAYAAQPCHGDFDASWRQVV